MGIRDYFDATSLVLVEWPQRGAPLLPAPDLLVDFQAVNEGRDVIISAPSARGADLLNRLKQSKD
jgi:tRNA threonylcarbamoyladenosine biosynthesis protein TsaE